ncbi:hypothetical protein PTKIN_Ptkin05aG0092600 [Pterospermum kingtungense]
MNPTEDPQRRLEQTASLATALKASGTDYTDELNYRPDINFTALENGGVQQILSWELLFDFWAGDVDYLKNPEHDDGDSMMTLLHASNPSKSLVICPDKRSNSTDSPY